ncbi:TatD family hydrolase, partial [[Clostridium] symbiosum]|uniref:TatD family hydrolase n=1 Tax=Clostridium symbiosum TaxID=1512 RepID=UPI00210C0323
WEEVIAGAKEAGIEKIMIVSTGLSEAERAIEIAKKESMFDVACAFYPNDILKVTDKDFIRLEELVKRPQVKAVGEIGMDYFPYEKTVQADIQRDAFIRQI